MAVSVYICLPALYQLEPHSANGANENLTLLTSLENAIAELITKLKLLFLCPE